MRNTGLFGFGSRISQPVDSHRADQKIQGQARSNEAGKVLSPSVRSRLALRISMCAITCFWRIVKHALGLSIAQRSQIGSDDDATPVIAASTQSPTLPNRTWRPVRPTA